MQSDLKRVISDLWAFPQKPKYQPQLQMIQLVGPDNNDYIYINFKDFEYDTKWEFPRENLELGMNHTRQMYKYTSAESEGVLTAGTCAMQGKNWAPGLLEWWSRRQLMGSTSPECPSRWL